MGSVKIEAVKCSHCKKIHKKTSSKYFTITGALACNVKDNTKERVIRFPETGSTFCIGECFQKFLIKKKLAKKPFVPKPLEPNRDLFGDIFGGLGK